jgi:iron complex transport system ATP-binding protein
VLMGRSPYLNRFQMESASDRAVAERALTATDSAHLADRMINTLSGGERQGVLLARALAQEPRLLLLDEPTSNLDLKHQHRALTLARQLARENALGVIVAVHDLALAARYCDRLILLLCGRVLAEGTPEQVLTPEHLRHAFDIEAQIYRDPIYNTLALAIRDI